MFCLPQKSAIVEFHNFLSFKLLITSNADRDIHFHIYWMRLLAVAFLCSFSFYFPGNKQLFHFFFSRDMTKELSRKKTQKA